MFSNLDNWLLRLIDEDASGVGKGEIALESPESTKDDSLSHCVCMNPPFHYKNYDSNFIGLDRSRGRLAEVENLICRLCGTKWLVYSIEHPGYDGSDRWFCVPATPEMLMLTEITANRAVALIESEPWHFCGGAFFKSHGKRSTRSKLWIDVWPPELDPDRDRPSEIRNISKTD